MKKRRKKEGPKSTRENLKLLIELCLNIILLMSAEEEILAAPLKECRICF